MGRDAIPHLLGSLVDMLCDGWEVCVKLAEGLHNRRSVWCILECSTVTIRRYRQRGRRDVYKLSRDAVVEFFDRALVGVSSECAFGCPIRSGVKDLDCVRHPGLSRRHPCIRNARIRDKNLEMDCFAGGRFIDDVPRIPSR